MILSCLIAVGCVNVFAGAVQGRFYNFVPQSIGYSEANFTGNYYGVNDERNNAIIYAASKGGETATYTTYLSAYLYGHNDNYFSNSDNTGSRTLTHTIEKFMPEYDTANAYTEHRCRNRSTNTVEWYDTYSYRWSGAQAGWVE